MAGMLLSLGVHASIARHTQSQCNARPSSITGSKRVGVYAAVIVVSTLLYSGVMVGHLINLANHPNAHHNASLVPPSSDTVPGLANNGTVSVSVELRQIIFIWFIRFDVCLSFFHIFLLPYSLLLPSSSFLLPSFFPRQIVNKRLRGSSTTPRPARPALTHGVRCFLSCPVIHHFSFSSSSFPLLGERRRSPFVAYPRRGVQSWPWPYGASDR